MNATRSIALVLTILPALLLSSGCASVRDDALVREQAIQKSDQRLAQREHELIRARRDLANFRKTHRHLQEFKPRFSHSSFDEWLERFVEERVDPLLSNDWQSTHPELSQLDIDLRLLRVEALIDLKRKRAAARAIREIARTYRGQEQMLVSNSRGQRETLEQSLVLLGREMNAM